MKPINWYNNDTDGTTYYHIDGVLYGHPTNKDETCSFDDNIEIAVDDYAEPISNTERNKIEKALHQAIGKYGLIN
jgi:hypothetical protein